MHFWKAVQGQKQWGVHPRDSFREQQWVGGEWKGNITKKNTQTRRGRMRKRAGGGGESSEIRVTLHHSGTCSPYKLKEKPKVCHWLNSLLSASQWIGLDTMLWAVQLPKLLLDMTEACLAHSLWADSRERTCACPERSYRKKLSEPHGRGECFPLGCQSRAQSSQKASQQMVLCFDICQV